MNILMIHFRVGATDGVSLEMNKWKHVLEAMGHKVIYAAAEENQAKAFLIPEMSILSDIHRKLFKNCYEQLTDYETPDELHKDILKLSFVIEEKLTNIIQKENIELMIPNNVSSLGLHLPTGIAIANVIKKLGIKTIYHHHDFFWERERYTHPTAPFIQKYLDTLFPYHVEGLTKHCLINHLAKEELYQRRQIEGYVVPNVFDFDEDEWVHTPYSTLLRKRLKIQDNDVVILQATRIEDRKAIELALDVTHALYQMKDHMIGKKLYDGRTFTKESNIHFVIAGLNEMRKDLFINLQKKMDSMPYQVHMIHEMIGSKRDDVKGIFALWDVYTISDAITYPSILEGWGNQLLEGLFAKKPIVIYEYPVFKTDIKPFGFNLISLGDQYHKNDDGYVCVSEEIIHHAAQTLIDTLTSQKTYLMMTSRNFEIAQKHLSYQALRHHIDSILGNI